MSERIVVLIGTSPASGKATSSFALVQQLVRAGHPVRVCLLQDGVLAGLKSDWAGGARAPAAGAAFQALDEDLALRGLGPQDLAQGVASMSYAELVDAIMEEGVQVVGML